MTSRRHASLFDDLDILADVVHESLHDLMVLDLEVLVAIDPNRGW